MTRTYRFRRYAGVTGLRRIGYFAIPSLGVRRSRNVKQMPSGRKKSANDLLAELDETYCVVRFGNKVRIFVWEDSDIYPGAKQPAFYAEQALKLYFGNQYISSRDRDGNSKRRLLFPYWLQRADSPRATGLTLDPTGGRFVDGKLNLWCGFGIDPAPGKWPLLKAHIEQVICGGEPDLISYLMKWLAWVLQNPARHAEVAVVLRGDKGTGKGIFGRLLLSIFATHGLHISNREHLVGKFNSHLMHCCFLFVDEALWPGDKPAEGVLKRIVTEPTLTVEPKGIDAQEAVNRLSIMMASNEDWVVPASSDERRFACFDVSAARKGDRSYFDDLDDELYRDGGDAAFLHDMLKTELGKWHPRSDIPQTKALAAQKLEFAPPEILWPGQILDAGSLPRSIRKDGEPYAIIDPKNPNLARSRLLWLQAKDSDPRLRYWSEPKFRGFLQRYGVGKAQRTAKGSFVSFPPLPEIRANFRKAHPWYPPFNEAVTEWQAELELLL